jgi:hypothetical protein
MSPKIVSNSKANELDGVVSVVELGLDDKTIYFENSSGKKEYAEVTMVVSSSQNGKTVKIYSSEDGDDWDYLTESRVS